MKSNHPSFQPIIIIGAGRSGTNMLRDVLTQVPGVGTWPCDEINYIWRHGNISYPTDELEPEQVTVGARRYIQRAFHRLAQHHKLQYVVEKTCANSLRIRFVDAILPDAKYLFIVRDGRDVVASAMKRWIAPLDLPYILKKARFVPVNDIPYYGVRYLGNRIYHLVSQEKRLAFWGPRFQGMKEMLKVCTLPEVCAAQWARCVEKANDDFSQIDQQRVFRLRYEDFVAKPAVKIKQLLDFLEVDASPQLILALTKDISLSSVGKWQTELSLDTFQLLEPYLRPTLDKYGYQ